MTMRDLFPDEDIHDDYAEQEEQQPQITDGAEQSQDGGIYDDGTSVMQGGDLSTGPRDFRYIDRFIKVKGMPNPARNSNEESNFLLSNDFSEQLILNFLTDLDQRKIFRSLADVMDLSEGSGNAKVALSESKLLASKIMMKRSSTENALNMNERLSHITNMNRSNITTKTNQIQPSTGGGWLSRLFGR
jgi:hypothetical protein